MKYQAELINQSGCVFDRASFATIKTAKEWARGRGGKNTLKLFKVDRAGEKYLSKVYSV